MKELKIDAGDNLDILIDSVIKEVAKYYKMEPSDLKKKSRKGTTLIPRQVAQYLLTKHLDFSLTRVANEFGQTHSNVINARDKIAGFESSYKDIKTDIAILKYRIKGIKIKYDNPDIMRLMTLKFLLNFPDEFVKFNISDNDLLVLGNEFNLDENFITMLQDLREENKKEEDKLIKHHKDELQRETDQINKKKNGEEVFGIRK